MGKLFKSWFKKKKKQRSIHSISSQKRKTNGDIDYAPSPQQQKPIHAKNQSKDEALTFTNNGNNSSLLDDVLGGWINHCDDDDNTTERMYAPDLPPHSIPSSHRHSLSISRNLTEGQFQHQQQHQLSTLKQQQQNQKKSRTISGFSENNRSSIYQHNMAQTPPTFRMAPETPGYSPCPPPSSVSSSTQDSSVIVTPSSATTPSLPLNVKSSSPPPIFASSSSSSSSPALLAQSNPLISNSSHHGGTTSAGAQSDALTTVETNISRPKTMVQQSQSHSQLLQQDQPLAEIPSLASHDSSQDKRNRYLQAAGVSMDRMKERHRQECRRSMQSNSNQLSIPSPPTQVEQTQISLPSSPSSPLLSIQRTQQSMVNQISHRPVLPSPSMPALNHLKHVSQPLATANAQFASTSFTQQMPSVVRSTSMMTDLHQLPRSTSGIAAAAYSGPASRISGVNTTAPMDQELSQYWRQSTLFPYQSDIVLPPYNPAQLSTIHQQQEGPMMMIPQSASYRMINNNNHKQAFPRSASVYGGQYHQQSQNDRIMTNYGSPGHLLRSTMLTDPNLQLSMINSGAQLRHQQRKSMSVMPRSYKPQLSLSNSPSTQSQLHIKKSKRNSECVGTYDDLHGPSLDTSEDTIVELPASFLPSSFSPSSNLKLTPTFTPEEAALSLETPSTSQTPQIQSSIPSSTKPTSGNNNEDKDIKVDEDAGPLDSSEKLSHRSNTVSSSSSASHQSDTPVKNKGNSGLDEKLEIPSLVDHIPTKLQQQTELRIMAKQNRQARRRRRFSLPTIPTLSPSNSTSSISSVMENEKRKVLPAKMTPDQEHANAKIQVHQPHETTNHASCDSDGHQHHQHLRHDRPVPACSTSTSRIPSSHIHGSPWTSTCHSCISPTPPLALCCPSSSSTSYHGGYPTCTSHPSSIPVPATPPSCCSSSNYTPSCCSRSHHRHRHHHCSHSQHRCHHRSSAMKKSSSMVIADPQSKLRQKGQKRQQQALEPSSHQSDDDTIAEVPISPSKKPTSSYSLQRPLFRSFLPRAPRFSTSIPRLQQQQQKPKAATSRSSYSWIPSRS